MSYMRKNVKSAIELILVITVYIVVLLCMYLHECSADTESIAVNPPVQSSEPGFFRKSAKDGLMDALEFYGIHHPDIVYAQAVLETGNFKSQGCIKDNNLFGLYNSKNKRYHRFNHWTDSVIAYKKWVQRRYRPPEDYYNFLKRIGYAKDKRYIGKLKRIVSYESESGKRGSVG